MIALTLIFVMLAVVVEVVIIVLILMFVLMSTLMLILMVILMMATWVVEMVLMVRLMLIDSTDLVVIIINFSKIFCTLSEYPGTNDHEYCHFIPDIIGYNDIS